MWVLLEDFGLRKRLIFPRSVESAWHCPTWHFLVGKITHTIGLPHVMAISTSEPMLTLVVNRLAMVL